MNPYSPDLIVDQVIGSAYQVVKYVAANMEALILLSDFIQSVTIEGLQELIDAIPELTDLHAHLTELAAIYSNLSELLALEVNLPMFTVIYDMLPELQEIYDNLPAIIDSSLAVAAAREAIVRSYSEAGYPMDKTESFEVGGTITTAKETLLYEHNGIGYSWAGSLPKSVPANSTPSTTGGIGPTAWVDQSTKLLRQQLTSFSGILTPANNWSDIPSNSDLELGGPTGPLNKQAMALADRTEYLFNRVNNLPTLPDIKTDPANQYFGSTGVVIDTTAGFISGEPFIVRDDANSQWVMYLFRTVSGTSDVRCYYRTMSYSYGLIGTWGAATEMPSLAGYHKFVLLVDIDGNPVQVGGNYHAYAVSHTAVGNSSKLVYHFTSSSLTGPWTLGANVLPKGAPGSKDEFFTDTPYAIYKDGTVYLWYMGAPAASLPTYGLAIRLLRATATTPDGPFTKSPADVLLPDTVNGKWDYGWLGGAQIRRRPNGRFMMVYNAGDTRPVAAGAEPATSRIGYAYSDSIDGPWLKDGGNPYFSPTGSPSDAVESANIWRGHMAYDHVFGLWSMFYNTGAGTEKITRADIGAYDYVYSPAPANLGNVIQLTTGLQTVPNSRVNLPAGRYRVVYQANLSDSGGTLPKLDIDTNLNINGAVYRTTREFIGSYAFENRDVIFNCIITLAAAGYVDLSVQVTSGTPTPSSYLRRLRVNIQKIT